MMRWIGIWWMTVVVAQAAPGEWLEFRGSEGNGHSSAKNLPRTWSATENIAWKVPVAGLGWSSPVVFQGTVFLTTAITQDADLSLQVWALSEKSGAILWTNEVFRPQPGAIHQKNSHASPTPVINDGKIFVHFGNQGTACLDLAGKIIWKKNDLKYPPVHGSGGSPLVLDDRLIFSCDGASDPFVVALRKSDGSLLWKTPRQVETAKKFAFATPILLEGDGSPQVILPGAGAVCAYDPKDGKELWRVRYDGYSVIPRPVVGHGLIFVSSGYDDPEVIAIRRGGQGDITDSHVAWKITRSAPNTPSMLIVGDELYFISDAGVISCADARTGKIHWQERAGGMCSASPVLADGHVYVLTEGGVCTVFKPGKTWQPVAVNKMEERILASPAVVDGALFIRGAENLYRVGK